MTQNIDHHFFYCHSHPEGGNANSTLFFVFVIVRL